MNILDEIVASFGPEALEPKGNRGSYNRWVQICICGHLDVHHSESVGGKFNHDAGTKNRRDGTSWKQIRSLHGCAGAVQVKGIEEQPTVDEETQSLIEHIDATCTCTEFRPIVKVNRPNRAFNQRMPSDRSDHARHPFIVGLRAFTTHLSKMKNANPETGGSPEWATAEFDRRFTWLDGARVCGISRCTKSDGDVWPCYVSDDGRSELRCGAHRPA